MGVHHEKAPNVLYQTARCRADHSPFRRPVRLFLRQRRKRPGHCLQLGEYIDPETLLMFEEEYGIKVIYDEFETNESMYPKVESGAVAYDIACPSDYMISRMIQNGMLSEINYGNIPNAKKISVLNTLSSPEGLILKISTPSLTAGELWAFSITGRWWRNRSPAGNSFGMKNTQTIF